MKNNSINNNNKDIIVYANGSLLLLLLILLLLLLLLLLDLNPESYKYLCENGKKNNCGNRLYSYNLDGRLLLLLLLKINATITIMKLIIREFILDLLERNVRFEEVIMNLPQNAIDFLDVFIGMKQRMKLLLLFVITIIVILLLLLLLLLLF